MNMPNIELATAEIVVIGLLSFLITTSLAVFFVVRLPRDYFANPRQKMLPPKSRPVLRMAVRIGKNVLGWILIVLGIFLAMPAMPGEGIVTLIIGLVLIDFPGKSRVEKRIIQIGWIRRSMNKVRGWFNRQPLKQRM